jgi:predicted site-specific integrase-resolvase
MTTVLAEAALSAHSCRLVVLDDSEVTDDLGRDRTAVLAPFCARRSARNRALTAAGRARRDVRRQADLEAGSVRCGGGG